MKTTIIALSIILISSVCSATESIIPAKTVSTECIGGYLFAIVVAQTSSGVSVDIEQIFEKGEFTQFPQAVKCR